MAKRNAPKAKARQFFPAAAIGAAAVLAGLIFGRALVEPAPSLPRHVPKGTPVVTIVEGKRGSPYPYNPSVVVIPAHKMVAVRLTDNLGGCGLTTVFQGLGVNGGNAQVTVPVGKTGWVLIRAPHKGTYSFHCAGNMWFGKVVAS